jgi:hypothetical protein
MNLPRTSAALVLTATLLSAAVPAAQARTLGSHQTPSLSGSWFDAAMAWLDSLGVTTSPTARSLQAPAVKSLIPPINLPPVVPVAHPNSGSTLDPNGHCNTWCGAGG